MTKQPEDRFYQAFANIPLSERKNPIYVDKEYGAMSWLVLKIEVENDTKVADRALEFLSKTGII